MIFVSYVIINALLFGLECCGGKRLISQLIFYDSQLQIQLILPTILEVATSLNLACM